MPRFVQTPVLCVTTQQLPTHATLHRPFRGSGPADGTFTRCPYAGLQRHAEGLSESPAFQIVSDRMSGLLVHDDASALQMQHAPAKRFSLTSLRRTGRTSRDVSGSTGRQREKKQLF